QQLLPEGDGDVPQPVAPLLHLLRREQRDGAESLAHAAAQQLDDAAVEEDPGRQRIREDEPDAAPRGRCRDAHRTARRRSPMRAASDAPSSPWKASASGGVQHAGQPSTPKTATARPSSSDARASSRSSASPRAPTGAWSSTTKTSSNGDSVSASQSGSMRLSQGMFTTWTRVPCARSASAAVSASCSSTGP